MKTQEQDSETTQTKYPYKHKLEIKEEKQAILSKIKYVTSRSIYDIFDRMEFNNFLDYLSFNSRKIQCQMTVKDFIWDSCPKQARGGVLVRNVVDLVAERLLDNRKLQFKQEMFDIFVKIQSRHTMGKKPQKQYNLKSISKTLLSGVACLGIGYQVGKKITQQQLYQDTKHTLGEIKEVFGKSNPHLQTSQIHNVSTAYPNAGSNNTGFHSSFIDGSRVIQEGKQQQIGQIIANRAAKQATKTVQDTIKNSSAINKAPAISSSSSTQNSYVHNSHNSGFTFSRIQSIFKTFFEFIGKKSKNYFLGLFFQRNKLEKTWRFSPMLSFCNAISVLQVVGLLYCVSLMLRKQKKQRQNYQIDKFFKQKK